MNHFVTGNKGAACMQHFCCLRSQTWLVMKLITVFLFMACMQVKARGIGQTVTFSVKEASLKNVFDEIQQQTGLNFFFKTAWLAQAKKVTLQVNNAPVKQALDLCFKNQPFTYIIVGESIVVKPNDKFRNGVQQEIIDTLSKITVWGKVLNERGEPIANASILVKKALPITITSDEYGQFRVVDVEEFTNIVISNVGYQPAEVTLTRKRDITVTLKFSVIELGDINVTVNTGYQELNKNTVTGSFVKVNNELFNRNVGSHVLTRLDGISSGVLFDKRNIDHPTNIQIRGLYTLTENIAQPLVVLDNFPYEGNISDINPNDIEDVTILKDAAAAAIWGAKAGNGVIVLTTKKGKFNQPLSVSFIGNVIMGDKPDLFGIPEIPASDYIDLEKYLFENGQYNRDINSMVRPVSPVVQILDDVRNGIISLQDADSKINSLRSNDVRNDFNKYLYRKSLLQQYMLNMTGGSSKAKYFFSAGFDKTLENLIGNDNRRITIKSENSFVPVKNMQVRVALSYVHGGRSNNSPGGYGTYSIGPRKMPIYSELADEHGTALPIDWRYKGRYTDILDPGLLDWKYRPVQELNNKDNTNQSRNFVTDLGILYNLTSSLTADLQYRYQQVSGIDENYYNANTYFTRDLVNLFTAIDGQRVIRPIPYDGILDYTGSKMEAYALRGQLNFKRTWRDKHSLMILGGGEIRSKVTTTHSSRAYGYNESRFGSTSIDYVNFFPLYTGAGDDVIPSNIGKGEYVNRFVSVYGNAVYRLLEKYTLSLSGRQDASNLFGVTSNNKWQPLWSAGLAWKISQERFYKSTWLPYLNGRWSYGYNGNVNNSMSALTTIGIRPGSWQITNLPYAVIFSYPNPELRWEKVRTMNMGLDFGIGNNLLTGSIEYYRKQSTDVIGISPLDPTVGISTLHTNSANISGSGVDIQIATKDVGNSTFKWRTNFVFSFVDFKIRKYLLPVNTNGFAGDGSFVFPIEGYNPYVVVSYKWAGLDPLTGEPQGYIEKNISKNYDSITYYTPLTEQNIHGSALPKYYGNIINTVSWRGLSLSANITYRFGSFFKKPSINYTSLVSYNWGHKDYVDRWKQPGDESHTNVPSFTYPVNGIRDMFYENAEIHIHKADHIRLEDIRLNYSLDRNRWTNMPFKQFLVYAYVSNLNMLLWKANKEGIDPGYPGGLIPPRSFTLGFNITF